MSDDKKGNSGRRFAIVSNESIKSYGESAGHSGLSDEVCSLLSEDVMYRLREAAQNSCQFMRHARRKKLTSEDFNKSLRNADVPPVFGYGSTDAMPFRQTKEGEVSFVEDGDVNLANIAWSTHVPHQAGKLTVKAHWLAVEGLPRNVSIGQTIQGKPTKPLRSLTDQQRQYLDSITKAILGSETELNKLALNDLRSNSNISPLLPYLLNFISQGVKTSTYDIPHLTKLLHTVRSLLKNPALFLQPKPYLNILIESVLHCVIEPLPASVTRHSNHWTLREFAARLLVQITRTWQNNDLEQKNLDLLLGVLYDLQRPLCSHYGAIMALGAFGTQAVEEILRPQLRSYIPHLESLMNSDDTMPQIKEDASRVHGAILLCCEYVIRARTSSLLKSAATGSLPSPIGTPKQHPEPPKPESSSTANSSPTKLKSDVIKDEALVGMVLQLPESTNPYKIAAELYAEFSDYFGDSLSTKLPINKVSKMYISKGQEDKLVDLGGEDSKKSGEELLQQILNAPLPPPTIPPLHHYGHHHHHHPHSRGPSRMHSFANGDEVESRSDIHSFYDDERSERSSRSERSHSDDLSFLDDSDLTVKTTVNDPSLGIKLTITKRPKTKSESSQGPPAKRQKQTIMRKEDVFVPHPMVNTNRTIGFRIRGSEQLRRKSVKPLQGNYVESEYHKLNSRLSVVGKCKQMRASVKKKLQRVHSSAVSLNIVL